MSKCLKVFEEQKSSFKLGPSRAGRKPDSHKFLPFYIKYRKTLNLILDKNILKEFMG